MDELVRDEHVADASTLYDFVVSKFTNEVHEDLQDVWASQVVLHLYTHRLKLFESHNITALQNLVQSFVAPHGSVTAEVSYLMHWMPEPDDADNDDEDIDESEWEDVETAQGAGNNIRLPLKSYRVLT